MTKVKICGLKSIKDVEIVNKYKPEYAGFVFANTKRFVSDTLAKEMREAMDSSIKTVGVFVNEPIDHVVTLCREGIIDVVQLHGDETEQYARDLKGRVDQPVIRAIRVQSTQQIMSMMNYPCDYFLFDTYRKDAYGGTGECFDRNLIPKLEKPYFLAGGLTVDNVKEALSECEAFCVDISSGVETEGVKDEEKVKDFIINVRKN